MARKAAIKNYVADGEVTPQGNDVEPVAAEDHVVEDPIDEKTMAEMRLGAATVARYAVATEAE